MYRKHGLKRLGGTEGQKLIAKLDVVFGKMIKERDRNETCITCGKLQTPQDDPRAWHAGHFRPRGFMATRFNPMNANKQCAHDNIYGEGLSYEHGLAIDRKYVKGTAALLYKESKKIKLWEEKELQQLLSAAKMGYPVYVQVYNMLA